VVAVEGAATIPGRRKHRSVDTPHKPKAISTIIVSNAGPHQWAAIRPLILVGVVARRLMPVVKAERSVV
jgi:hypothetical protein